MSQKKYRTDSLFPNTTILTGIGSIFNLRGDYFQFNYCADAEEADLKAIESDWGVIGQDIEQTLLNNSIESLLPSLSL